MWSGRDGVSRACVIQSQSLSLTTVSSSLFLSWRHWRRNNDLSTTMISPTHRRHQPESVSVKSSPLSLCGQRIQFSIGLLDDSASLSLSVSSSNLRLLVSLRRFHLPLDLLDDSAYLSLSTTAHSTFLSGPWLSSTKSNRNQKLSFSLLRLNHLLFYWFVCCDACVSCVCLCLMIQLGYLCLCLLIIQLFMSLSVFISITL